MPSICTALKRFTEWRNCVFIRLLFPALFVAAESLAKYIFTISSLSLSLVKSREAKRDVSGAEAANTETHLRKIVRSVSTTNSSPWATRYNRIERWKQTRHCEHIGREDGRALARIDNDSMWRLWALESAFLSHPKNGFPRVCCSLFAVCKHDSLKRWTYNGPNGLSMISRESRFHVNSIAGYQCVDGGYHSVATPGECVGKWMCGIWLGISPFGWQIKAAFWIVGGSMFVFEVDRRRRIAVHRNFVPRQPF